MSIGEEVFEEPLDKVQDFLFLSTHEIHCDLLEGIGGTTLAVPFNEFEQISENLDSRSRVRTDDSFDNGHVGDEHLAELTNVGSFVVTGSIESYGQGAEFIGEFVVKVCP